jgi:hypothetical protein
MACDNKNMEIYITKKMTPDDELTFPALDTLPHVHIVTTPVTILSDGCGNYYIAEEATMISKLLKFKKAIVKQKLTDDIIWVKPSPIMQYKNNKHKVYCSKMIIGVPVKVQLSCRQSNVITYEKPYQTANLVWTIDAVFVDDNFDFQVLAT